MSVRRHATGGPWEEPFGYSRAVRVGGRILVSGCTAVVDGEVLYAGDPGAQAEIALRCAIEAVEALGGDKSDVVRTRMYVVHRRDADPVGRAHGRAFGAERPAATMVVVAGLLDPGMLVEIEVEAEVGAGDP